MLMLALCKHCIPDCHPAARLTRVGCIPSPAVEREVYDSELWQFRQAQEAYLAGIVRWGWWG
jgi:hypothetical protein